MSSTRFLLRCGAVAGPVYLAIGLAQIIFRQGFDVRRHALSLLSNGPAGWIQVANFLVGGVLVVAGAIGTRRLLSGRRAGGWGSVLLGLYGIGLVGAGLFSADPGRGFPPGAPEVTTMTSAGLLHFVFGGVGFYALIGACFVFARRFAAEGLRGWALYSLLTGAGFFCAFAAIASGSTAVLVMLAFYLAVAGAWIWHTAVMVKMHVEATRRP
jgi:hypothetical protein